jgi:hypothetical protein
VPLVITKFIVSQIRIIIKICKNRFHEFHRFHKFIYITKFIVIFCKSECDEIVNDLFGSDQKFQNFIDVYRDFCNLVRILVHFSSLGSQPLKNQIYGYS